MTSLADGDLQKYYAALAVDYDDARRHHVEAAPENEHLRATIPPMFAGRRVLDVALRHGCLDRADRPACPRSGRRRRQSEHARHGAAAARAPRHTARHRQRLRTERHARNLRRRFRRFLASHVPRSRVDGFLAGLHRRLAPGALVDTFQIRRLADGSSFRVLKNFPSRSDLVAWTEPFGTHPEWRERAWFWTFSYDSVRSTAEP